MKNALSPLKPIHAYYEGFDGRYLTLRIGNIQQFPVKLNGIVKNGTKIFSPLDESIIKQKYSYEPVKYKKIRFKPNAYINWRDSLISELGIEVEVINSDSKSIVQISDLPEYMDDFLKTDFVRQRPNIDQMEFLSVDEKEKKIEFKSGKWELKKDLIIPAGYIVTAGSGTAIDLTNNSKILSYSPFKFVGSEDIPIIIQSTDGRGQGIAILDAKDRSTFRHVIFENLSTPRRRGWELTGAITFYQSPVDISDCKFTNNNYGDDFLNIVRSDFDLRDSFFSETFADAIDIDFSVGTMSNLRFEHTENDAIDFSGSKVRLENIYIDQALDKAISVGEESYIRAKNVEIKRSKIALASKDSSKLEIENLKLEDCSIGFTVFQKKPEFGPAQIIGNSVSKENIDKPYLVQEGSKLIIDGKLIQSSLL